MKNNKLRKWHDQSMSQSYSDNCRKPRVKCDRVTMACVPIRNLLDWHEKACSIYMYSDLDLISFLSIL